MASGEKPLPENSSPDESIGGRGSPEFENRSLFRTCHAYEFLMNALVTNRLDLNRICLALDLLW